jgi:hypothetical protein
MEIETFTCIEVTNEPHIWAIDLFQCKKEMGPVVPEFVLVGNGYNHENQVDYVDHTLVDTKPEKIINGVNGSISDSYKEVGFWKIKKQVIC